MTEIDDEMVARAYEAYRAAYSPTGHASEMIRAALVAALSPKPEPEIEVSLKMVDAALDALLKHSNATDRAWADFYASEVAPIIYRAMESTRLKEAAYAAKPAPQGVSAAAPVKETGGGSHSHAREGDFDYGGPRYTRHRRKTDK